MIVVHENCFTPYAHLDTLQQKLLIVPKNWNKEKVRSFIKEHQESLGEIEAKYSQIIHATKRVVKIDEDEAREMFEDCWALFSAKTGVTEKPLFVVENMETLGRYNRSSNTVFLNQLVLDMCISYRHACQIIMHELCHMIIRGHGDDFHALLSKFYKNARRLNEEQSYAIRIRTKQQCKNKGDVK